MSGRSEVWNDLCSSLLSYTMLNINQLNIMLRVLLNHSRNIIICSAIEKCIYMFKTIQICSGWILSWCVHCEEEQHLSSQGLCLISPKASGPESATGKSALASQPLMYGSNKGLEKVHNVTWGTSLKAPQRSSMCSRGPASSSIVQSLSY